MPVPMFLVVCAIALHLSDSSTYDSPIVLQGNFAKVINNTPLLVSAHGMEPIEYCMMNFQKKEVCVVSRWIHSNHLEWRNWRTGG